MAVVMQKTKKRMGFTFKIQEVEYIREALCVTQDIYRGQNVLQSNDFLAKMLKRLEKNFTKRLAREQEWIAAGGKVSHAP